MPPSPYEPVSREGMHSGRSVGPSSCSDTHQYRDNTGRGPVGSIWCACWQGCQKFDFVVQLRGFTPSSSSSSSSSFARSTFFGGWNKAQRMIPDRMHFRSLSGPSCPSTRTYLSYPLLSRFASPPPLSWSSSLAAADRVEGIGSDRRHTLLFFVAFAVSDSTVFFVSFLRVFVDRPVVSATINSRLNNDDIFARFAPRSCHALSSDLNIDGRAPILEKNDATDCRCGRAQLSSSSSLPHNTCSFSIAFWSSTQLYR
jgi:hypothetical protein